MRFIDGLTLALLGAATAVCVAFANSTMEPLSPGSTLLIPIVLFFAGLLLVLYSTLLRDSGLYGAAFARSPRAVHVLFQAIGCSVVGTSVLLVLRMAPAGAGEIEHSLPILAEYCQGPLGLRLERDVLPTVDGLMKRKERQSSSLQAELDQTVQTTLSRCGLQALQAMQDPEGTHSSWDRLRTYLNAHPGRHTLGPEHPLFSIRFVERRVEEVPTAVPVFLE